MLKTGDYSLLRNILTFLTGISPTPLKTGLNLNIPEENILDKTAKTEQKWRN